MPTIFAATLQFLWRRSIEAAPGADERAADPWHVCCTTPKPPLGDRVRILMTTDSVGGVWPYTIELSEKLAAHGCEVILACMGGELGAERRSEAERLPNVTLHESRLRLEWMEEPWSDVERAGKWLEALFHASRCDLLHLNCYGPALHRFGAPLLLVAHSCVHSWWRATRRSDPDASWKRYRECVIHALGTADLVVAPTRASLAAMRRCYEEAAPSGRVRVIYNGVDARRWSGERSSSAAPFVLGVGRVWDEAKNLRQLAAVARDLDCPVMIAGAGTLDEADARVTLLGPLPRAELADYYRRAAVFAHPARYEPFGLAVLEAALCGCPLVLGDIASLRELWDGAALFADPDDTRAWRELLLWLTSDPIASRRLGEAARARALRYSSHRMAAAYASQYEQLLDVRAKGAA